MIVIRRAAEEAEEQLALWKRRDKGLGFRVLGVRDRRGLDGKVVVVVPAMRGAQVKRRTRPL